jgi:hypothetical protein
MRPTPARASRTRWTARGKARPAGLGCARTPLSITTWCSPPPATAHPIFDHRPAETRPCAPRSSTPTPRPGRPSATRTRSSTRNSKGESRRRRSPRSATADGSSRSPPTVTARLIVRRGVPDLNAANLSELSPLIAIAVVHRPPAAEARGGVRARDQAIVEQVIADLKAADDRPAVRALYGQKRLASMPYRRVQLTRAAPSPTRQGDRRHHRRPTRQHPRSRLAGSSGR